MPLKMDVNAEFQTFFTANETSGFDGLMSTSNHLVPEEDTVFIETSRPIWWVAELREEGIQ
jgi:thiamine pyrophosphokinase